MCVSVRKFVCLQVSVSVCAVECLTECMCACNACMLMWNAVARLSVCVGVSLLVCLFV